MDIAFQIWMTVSVGLVAAMAGFWLGRSRRWLFEEAQVNSEEYEATGDRQGMTRVFGDEERGVFRLRRGERRVDMGKCIGSPATGVVSAYCQGSRKGALIQTMQGMVYAPASGKITKVFPGGNAFLLRTELGTEVYLQAGMGEEELLGNYYRPRVITNEIVNKGKLILEFDQEGLLSEGVDTRIGIFINQNEGTESVSVTPAQRVKVGEPLLWVRD